MSSEPTPRHCVFCDIIAGDAPATFLADGISSVAFAPLNPVTEGHILIVPRRHVADAYEDPGVTAMTMHDAAQLSRLLSWRDPRYKSANIITSIGTAATQTVRHLHLHLVPRVQGDGLALPWSHEPTRSHAAGPQG